MKHIFLALALISLAACQQAKEKVQAELPELYPKVVEVHDEAMAKMDELNNLRKRLEDTIATVTDTTLVKQYQSAISYLKKADAGMFDWMHDFVGEDSVRHMAAEQAKAYLEAQMQSAESMAKDIYNSIDQAKNLLK
jgi:hypothetical protein